MTDYNDGKWHGWNGGKCPVHPNTKVRYACRDGMFEMEAGCLDWLSTTLPIEVFKVVKEHKEPREFWLWLDSRKRVNELSQVKIEKETVRFLRDNEIIHVREVIE